MRCSGCFRDGGHRLLRFTADAAIAGVIRERQYWIGGNDYNPIGASYVPPPPEHVGALLKDLCAFVNRNDVAPVAQAAIAHAQFETIHPFADGTVAPAARASSRPHHQRCYASGVSSHCVAFDEQSSPP